MTQDATQNTKPGAARGTAPGATGKQGWTAERIPDQTGRVAVVTGANSGLGLATARALAHRGGHVILAVRDEEKGRRAAAGITAGHAGASVEVRRLDLADLDSVRAFSASLHADRTRLDVLVNNAGLMAPPRSTSAQGHELQFACNHLGHFALTGLLLDLLAGGRDPRVVTVTSVNHRKAHLDFDDLNGERAYRPMTFYDRSKLANAVFGHELHLLTASGSPVRSLLAHPGYTATHLQTSSPTGLVKLVFGTVLRPLAQRPEAGALPQLYAATAPEARGGDLIGPDGRGELRGAPTRVEPRRPRTPRRDAACGRSRNGRPASASCSLRRGDGRGSAPPARSGADAAAPGPALTPRIAHRRSAGARASRLAPRAPRPAADRPDAGPDDEGDREGVRRGEGLVQDQEACPGGDRLPRLIITANVGAGSSQGHQLQRVREDRAEHRHRRAERHRGRDRQLRPGLDDAERQREDRRDHHRQRQPVRLREAAAGAGAEHDVRRPHRPGRQRERRTERVEAVEAPAAQQDDADEGEPRPDHVHQPARPPPTGRADRAPPG